MGSFAKLQSFPRRREAQSLSISFSVCALHILYTQYLRLRTKWQVRIYHYAPKLEMYFQIIFLKLKVKMNQKWKVRSKFSRHSPSLSYCLYFLHFSYYVPPLSILMLSGGHLGLIPLLPPSSHPENEDYKSGGNPCSSALFNNMNEWITWLDLIIFLNDA